MLWLFLALGIFFTFLLYCCIVIGDDRKYYDEYFGRIKVNTYYNQEERKIIADWSYYDSHDTVIINYYTRQEGPEAAQPQFFPHGVVRVFKETKEVYDWYDLSEH